MIEHPYMEGKTLHEKQSQFFNAHRCPYCGEQTQLIDSIKVYRESYGLIFYCERDAAWVGVHKGTDQSMGTLAKKPLRDLRHQCHLVLDPLWQRKKALSGLSVRAVRGKAYNWVSELLGIEREAAHIGFLNSEQCKILINECKKYYLNNEQKQEIAAYTQLNSTLIESCIKDLSLESAHFKLNGIDKYEIKHPQKNKIFHYFPRTNAGGWDIKKTKALEVEIEVFMYKNFETKDEQSTADTTQK